MFLQKRFLERKIVYVWKCPAVASNLQNWIYSSRLENISSGTRYIKEHIYLIGWQTLLVRLKAYDTTRLDIGVDSLIHGCLINIFHTFVVIHIHCL